MSQIFDRLGNLLRSLSSEDPDTSTYSDNSFADADYEAAMRELDDMLNDSKSSSSQYKEKSHKTYEPKVPEHIQKAADTLGVTLSDSMESIKKAYKKKLVANHPDRFANEQAAFERATEFTKQLNQAYAVIEKYKSK